MIIFLIIIIFYFLICTQIPKQSSLKTFSMQAKHFKSVPTGYVHMFSCVISYLESNSNMLWINIISSSMYICVYTTQVITRLNHCCHFLSYFAFIDLLLNICETLTIVCHGSRTQSGLRYISTRAI